MPQETSAGVQEAQLQRRIRAVQQYADAAAPPRGRYAQSPLSRSVRILLVEDDADGGNVLGRLLKSVGHVVTIAQSCASARDACEAEFDLLLGDIALPDGSGLELVAQLKQRRPSIKAIALTGYGSDSDIAASLNAGFDAHLTKPITLEQLTVTIKRLCP